MSYPQSTTSGMVLPGLSAVEIWELGAPLADPARPPVIEPQLFAQTATRLIALEGAELESAVAGSQIEARIALARVPAEAAELHAFAVRTLSSTGDPSDYSNIEPLVLRAVAPAPRLLEVRATADGVELQWEPAGESQGYNIYRRASEVRAFGDPVARAAAADRRLLDGSAVFGTRYIYTLRAVASENPLVESAPASPSQDTIGYHLDRQDPGGVVRRITEAPVRELEYLDQGLTSGIRFLYRAAAVDGVGNEGPPSEWVAAVVE
jgi:hypothetical protein